MKEDCNLSESQIPLDRSFYAPFPSPSLNHAFQTLVRLSFLIKLMSNFWQLMLSERHALKTGFTWQPIILRVGNLLDSSSLIHVHALSSGDQSWKLIETIVRNSPVSDYSISWSSVLFPLTSLRYCLVRNAL
jgi:hypothetical protein